MLHMLGFQEVVANEMAMGAEGGSIRADGGPHCRLLYLVVSDWRS